MGKTLSDINRQFYAEKRSEGYSHEEIVESVPKYMRDKFKSDIHKSAIESHYGVSDKTFYLTFVFIFIVFIVLVSTIP